MAKKEIKEITWLPLIMVDSHRIGFQTLFFHESGHYELINK